MSRGLLTFVVLGKLAAVIGWLAGLPGPAMAVLFFAAGTPAAYALLAPNAQGLGPVRTRFVTDRREVWLTIDDGPDPDDTPKILDLLDIHRATATFFVVGERVQRHPELIREIVRRGHAVAHHTHTHPEKTFWLAGPGRLRRELDATLAVLAQLGVVPRWFRPPAGIKHPGLWKATRARGMDVVGWSLRSWDSVRTDPEALARSVLRRVRPGDILLFHEGPRLHASVRVQALARVLGSLAETGYTCIRPEAHRLR